MKQRLQTIDLIYIALGAVLIAICSWISIPTTVPFTLQTLAVCFVLSALGGKRGTASILIYILLGAVGMPVFAGFASGIGILLGNTGGYIAGFIIMGLVYWLFERVCGKKPWVEILSMLLGLVVLYAFGTAWFLFVYARTSEPVGLWLALSWCVFPFVVPDLVKMGLALVLARRVTFALNRSKVRL